MMVRKIFKSKKWIFIGFIILLLVAAGIALMITLKKPTSISELGRELHTNNGLLRGSNGGGAYYLNANETGIFYLDSDRMHYIDYDNKNDYILCSRADCKHTDENCGAYIADAFGFCAVEDSLFAWVENPDGNTTDLLCMDMNGENRSVLTSISMGGHEVGEYELSQFNLSDVYYGFGKAYVTLTYYQVKPVSALTNNGFCKRQVVTIDLTTGEQSVLFEQEGVDLFFVLEIQAISSESIVFTVSAAPEGEGKDIDAFNEADNSQYSSYESYYSDMMTNMNFSAYYYSFEDSSLVQFWDSPCAPYYGDDGQPEAWYDAFFCLGWYNGSLLACFETSTDSVTRTQTIQQYDPKTGLWNSMATLKNSGLVMYSFGTVGNYILDGDKVFYIHYDDEPETTGCICYYDLKTHQNKELYSDAWNVTFRFSGEYQDFFIGDMMVNDKHGVYLLRKEDYFSGDLKRAELLLAV